MCILHKCNGYLRPVCWDLYVPLSSSGSFGCNHLKPLLRLQSLSQKVKNHCRRVETNLNFKASNQRRPFFVLISELFTVGKPRGVLCKQDSRNLYFHCSQFFCTFLHFNFCTAASTMKCVAPENPKGKWHP